LNPRREDIYEVDDKKSKTNLNIPHTSPQWLYAKNDVNPTAGVGEVSVKLLITVVYGAVFVPLQPMAGSTLDRV
jgi:hypothetical protein